MSPPQDDHARLLLDIARVEKDLQSHSGTLDAFTKAFIEIDKREAVRASEEKHLDERLDRIEASIKGVHSLGKWILAALGSGILAAIVTFVVNGGLSLG